LVFRFAPAQEQVKLLLAGEVDLVTELPGTMTTSVEASSQARVAKQRTFWTVGATMNTDSGALSDVRVRRALNLAIDREALVRYDIRGNGSALATLTMPGEEGHAPDLEPYPHDPDAARRLLEQAGVEMPLVLKALVRAQAQRTALIIKAQLEKIGVQLDIQAVYSDAEVIRGLQSEAWDIAIAGLPDPMCHSFFIQSILLFSKSPFSLQNDPEFDRRLMEVVQTLDDAQRARLGRELDHYVYEQALSLFTYQKIKTYGARLGVEFTPYISGMPYFFDARIVPRPEAAAATAATAATEATAPLP
ncbi:MAG TPA: ABC transporter substrate-binding protein, partial [Phycisphaeraceae bacterium]